MSSYRRRLPVNAGHYARLGARRYQPPRQSALAARRFCASSRSCLRLSNRDWMMVRTVTSTAKKAIVKNITLVTALSFVSPYQPWPASASAFGTESNSAAPEALTTPMTLTARIRGLSVPHGVGRRARRSVVQRPQAFLHGGDRLEESGVVSLGSRGHLDVINRSLKHSRVQRRRELALFAGRHGVVFCRDDHRGGDVEAR